MYAAPNVAQSSGSSTIAKTSLPVFAAICCGSILLLLLAATIVLALIPIYLPKKTLTTSTKASQSAPVTMSLPTGQTINAKRKRQSSGSTLSPYVGCTLNAASTAAFGSSLLGVIQQGTSNAQSTNNLTVTVGTTPASSHRKRSLSRQKRRIYNIILIVRFIIIFIPSCGPTCQTSSGSKTQVALQTRVTTTTFPLSNVGLISATGVAIAVTIVIVITGPPTVSAIGKRFLIFHS
jgi:hypothetical protein